MTKKEGNWLKRHKKLIAVIAVIAVIAAISSSASDTNKAVDSALGSAGTSDTQKSEKSDTKAQVAKMGKPARDGKFEFTVNSLKCGEKTVGSQYLSRKAQGQFCRVNVTVKNIGDVAQTLDSSSQYAYNAQDQKYSADDEAAIYATTDDNAMSAWYNDINPGNTVKGDIFFDVPTGVEPVKVELHDSAFSGGVVINLN